jgi:hypothetical protein
VGTSIIGDAIFAYKKENGRVTCISARAHAIGGCHLVADRSSADSPSVHYCKAQPRAIRLRWKAAIDDDGYAQPPDGWMMPRAQQAALEHSLQAQ